MKQKINCSIKPTLLTLVCTVVLMPTQLLATTVTNNVTVKSSSGQTSGATVEVRTIRNGVLVEDYQASSSTGNINYSSEYNSENGIVVISAVSEAGDLLKTQRNSLLEIIALLQELISRLAIDQSL